MTVGLVAAFALKAPHAVLSDGSETTVIHFAGPSWQALDGSPVTGTRLAGIPAPDVAAQATFVVAEATPGPARSHCFGIFCVSTPTY
ncbi:MAG: hypothetical protein ABI560_16045 [Myxococcales bacterium]